MTIYHLKDWAVKYSSNNPYLAPECRDIQLVGFRVEDQKYISTSSIIKVVGKNIHTYSGSIYILEDINPNYLKWMHDNKINFDPKNPIKVKE